LKEFALFTHIVVFFLFVSRCFSQYKKIVVAGSFPKEKTFFQTSPEYKRVAIFFN